jgi:protein-arginine kinase activator protein McsA
MQETVVANPPEAVNRAVELRQQIELAVVEERYEDAAMLRDELRRLEDQK